MIASFLQTDCRYLGVSLGENEAIRTYTEFDDGTHRGMYDPENDIGGYPDEAYDATTAMVINWHRLPESEPKRDETVAIHSDLNLSKSDVPEYAMFIRTEITGDEGKIYTQPIYIQQQ